jgi:uncharacterized protein YprB with RNaseH-like and TPR domain
VGWWEDFLAAPQVPGLSPARLSQLKAGVAESLKNAARADYFARRLTMGEHWRLFDAFRAGAAFLDIETTGATWAGQQVTVVGLYRHGLFQQFIEGYNLRQFPAAIAGVDILVTFNGAQFDLPVLRANFPGLKLPAGHVDLRFLLKRLGYRGGLKKIEPHFGILRPPEVAGMDGYEAVLLWQRHRRGDRTALELLLTYNREDVLNLEILMDQAYQQQRQRLLLL